MLLRCKFHRVHFQRGFKVNDEWSEIDNQESLINELSIIAIWAKCHRSDHFNIDMLFYNENNELEQSFYGAI